MATKHVGVIPTGTANLASVLAGLRRAHATPFLIAKPEDITTTAYVMLPGVGAFGAAIKELLDKQMLEPLRERIQQHKPTMGICLGLQLFCKTSDESPGIGGLGILPYHIEAFAEPLRVPQFGWSLVSPSEESTFFEEGYAYFANSYCLRDIPPGWDVALSDYGGPYVAAMRQGPLVACQFHPELSSQWGQTLMQNWLTHA
jgi:imidazole glycerol phosphate synthase glutamine amidotransferase subunit